MTTTTLTSHLVYTPSPNQGAIAIACLVATLLCWVGLSLSGARLIKKNFLFAISDYGHPISTSTSRLALPKR